MAEKRIIVDHQHALRQHKAFAFMVIVSLLVVLAVWFVQVKLMVRTVDFTKLQQSVADAQAVFGSEEVKSEKEKRPEGVPSEVEGAQTKDGTEAGIYHSLVWMQHLRVQCERKLPRGQQQRLRMVGQRRAKRLLLRNNLWLQKNRTQRTTWHNHLTRGWCQWR